MLVWLVEWAYLAWDGVYIFFVSRELYFFLFFSLVLNSAASCLVSVTTHTGLRAWTLVPPFHV